MKSIVAFACLFSAVTVVAPTSAQAPASSGVEQLMDVKVMELAKEVQTQQAQLLDNQTKIEAKLAEIAETIRVARIFIARTK